MKEKKFGNEQFDTGEKEKKKGKESGREKGPDVSQKKKEETKRSRRKKGKAEEGKSRPEEKTGEKPVEEEKSPEDLKDKLDSLGEKFSPEQKKAVFDFDAHMLLSETERNAVRKYIGYLKLYEEKTGEKIKKIETEEKREKKKEPEGKRPDEGGAGKPGPDERGQEEKGPDKEREEVVEARKLLEERRREFARVELAIEDLKLKGKMIDNKDIEHEFARIEDRYRMALRGVRETILGGATGVERELRSNEILIETVAKEATNLYDVKRDLRLEARSGSKFEKIKNLGKEIVNRYRKIPFRYKILLSAGLLGVGTVAGMAGGATGAALATGVVTGRWLQRVLGASAVAVGAEALVKKFWHERRERKEVLRDFSGEIIGFLDGRSDRLDDKIFQLESGKKGKERRRYFVAALTGALVGGAATIYQKATEWFGSPVEPPPGVDVPEEDYRMGPPAPEPEKPEVPEVPPAESPQDVEIEKPGDWQTIKDLEEGKLVSPPSPEVAEVIERGISSNFTLELGEGEVPPYLERVFHAMAIDHMEDVVGADGLFGAEEGAKSLNMAANLVQLAEGRGVAGIDPERISEIFNWDAGNNALEIKDYAEFNKLLGELEEHSGKLWDQGDLQKGAATYLDNIKPGTWQKIIEAEGLKEAGGAETGIQGHEIEPGQIADFSKDPVVLGAKEALDTNPPEPQAPEAPVETGEELSPDVSSQEKPEAAPEEVAGEEVEKSPVKEGADEPLEELAGKRMVEFEGGKAEFVYDDSGNILRVNNLFFDQELRNLTGREFLSENYREMIQKRLSEDRWGVRMATIDSDGRNLTPMVRAYEKLSSTGYEKESEFVLGLIKRSIRFMENIYGEGIVDYSKLPDNARKLLRT